MKIRIGSVVVLLLVSLTLTVIADLLPLGVTFAPSPEGSKVVALSSTAQDLITQGKNALNSHAILAARDFFRQAVSVEPTNQEAQLLYGVSRLFAIYEDGQTGTTTGLDSIREILERSGIIFQTFGLYDTTYSRPKKPAPTTPSTGEVLEFVKTHVLAEVDGAIANLEAVTNQLSFFSMLSPQAFGRPHGNTLVIDYADVLTLKSLVYALKCNLELLLVYGLDLNIPQLADNPDQLTTYKKFFQNDSTLLTPIDPGRLATAKGALVSFIDIFTTASFKVSSRTDTLPHLFVVDTPLNSGAVHTTSKSLTSVRDALAQIKASLNGPIKYTFTSIPQINLSRFFDSSYPLNLRAHLADSTTALPDPTLNGLFPQGLDLGTLRQKYGADVVGILYAGKETPFITVTPERIMLYEYNGTLADHRSITINNNGTGPLQVTDMRFVSGNSSDFRLSFGSCGSYTPTVSPAGSCTVTVSFKHPAVAGYKYASLRITSNDSSTPVTNTLIYGYTSGDGTDLIMKGDINGDGIVNVFDALLTLQYAVNLIPHNALNDPVYLALADVAPLENSNYPKGDGKVDVFDALATLRYAVNLDTWVPPVPPTVQSTVNGEPTSVVATGDVVTLTATVRAGSAPVPTGTVVTFFLGSTQVGTGATDVTGSASVTLPTTGLATGEYIVTAGTTWYGSGDLKVTLVNPTAPKTIALTASKTTVTQGDNVTFTAEVKDGQTPPQPVRNALVTFSFGAASKSAYTDTSGRASATLAAATLGTMTATATLGNITSTTVPVTVKAPVVVGTVTLTANPASIPGDNTTTSTLTATVIMSDGSTAPDGTTVNFTTADSKLTLSAASAATTGGTATVTVKAGSMVAGSGTVTASVGTKSGSATVSYTAFTKPTKALVTVSTTGTLSSGSLIGAVNAKIRSPDGIAPALKSGTIQIATTALKTTELTNGSTMVGNYTNNLSTIGLINADGFGAGLVFVLTYDIPASATAPVASDFVLTEATVGDNSGPIAGMGLALSVAFQ